MLLRKPEKLLRIKLAMRQNALSILHDTLRTKQNVKP